MKTIVRKKRTRTLGAPAAYDGRRQPGPHGKTIDMLAVDGPAATYVVEYRTKTVKARRGMQVVVKDGPWVPHTGASRDRSLPGKARRAERKLARRIARTPFFKGHGVAGANDFNVSYECPCGFGIIAPLDDFDFMTDVMDHEATHEVSA